MDVIKIIQSREQELRAIARSHDAMAEHVAKRVGQLAEHRELLYQARELLKDVERALGNDARLVRQTVAEASLEELREIVTALKALREAHRFAEDSHRRLTAVGESETMYRRMIAEAQQALAREMG